MVKLSPGEMAVFNRKDNSITVNPMNVREDESHALTAETKTPYGSEEQSIGPTETRHEIPVWAFEGIKLNNVSPDSLIRIIEKTYNVKLNPPITGAITDNFTGTLPDNDLNRALYILSRIYRFDMPFTSKKEEQP